LNGLTHIAFHEIPMIIIRPNKEKNSEIGFRSPQRKGRKFFRFYISNPSLIYYIIFRQDLEKVKMQKKIPVLAVK
jgi:hypothetical protein